MRIHICNLDQLAKMDSKTLRRSDPPHQRNDYLMMPNIGCVWKISGDMFVTGSHGKKMDGQGRWRNGL